jgi:hypothetical protein
MTYRADCAECQRLKAEMDDYVVLAEVSREALELMPKDARHYDQIQRNLTEALARLRNIRDREIDHFATHDS